MTYANLVKALHTEASHRDDDDNKPRKNPSIGAMIALARLLDGRSLYDAFGAPGDWGYETAVGEALAGLYMTPDARPTTARIAFDADKLRDERFALRHRVGSLETERNHYVEQLHEANAENAMLRARVAELEEFTRLTGAERTSTMFAAGLDVVTRAVREADQLHQTVGGGTRHYVSECLLPCFKDEGLAIIVVGKAHYDDDIAQFLAEREAKLRGKVDELRDVLDDSDAEIIKLRARVAELSQAAGEVNDALGVLDLCMVVPLVRGLEAREAKHLADIKALMAKRLVDIREAARWGAELAFNVDDHVDDTKIAADIMEEFATFDAEDELLQRLAHYDDAKAFAPASTEGEETDE